MHTRMDMTLSAAKRRTKRGAIAALSILAAACAARLPAAQDAWHVSTAPLRFRVDLTQHPAPPSAGYIVHLPDGGILPGSTPVSRVIDATGAEHASYCLYYTPAHGFVVLFAAPRTIRSVYIYMESAMQVNAFTPASGLTPGMLLYVKSGRGALSAAKQIGAGKTREDTRVLRLDPEGDPPIRISCEDTHQNLYGMGGAYAAHLTGYLHTTDPGRTWISAFSMFLNRSDPSQQGMEVYIDDERIQADTTLSDKSCGTGQWLNLSRGLHKLDIYHAASPADRFGALLMTWRTPNTTVEELGGLRGSDLPHPNTPMWEARPLRREEIAQSGHGVVRAVEQRNGAPVAGFTITPRRVFWLTDESKALLMYEFEAMTDGHPAGTDYTWRPAAGAQRTGTTSIRWLYPAYREHRMQLSVSADSRTSSMLRPFFAFERGLAGDLNDAATRQDFRHACLDMLQAAAPNDDPTAQWSDTMWTFFFQTLELGASRPLLAEIFSRHWPRMRRNLDAPSRWRLEDFFYEWLSFKEPERCIAWLEAVEKNESHAERRKELRLMQAEVHLYALGDPARARMLATRATAGAGELSRLATVRLGDIEFLAGRVQEATRLYGSVQSRAALDPRLAAADAGLQWSAPPAWKQAADAPRRSPAASTTHARIDDWKKSAVLNTSAAETARTLLEQGYYEQARHVLKRWETLIPLSKISSNYVVYEADLLMYLGNYRRAGVVLDAYCKHIELTSFLPAAAERLLTCLLKTQATDEELVAFCTQMKKRLPFHPLAAKMDTLLKMLERGVSDRNQLLEVL